MTGVIKKSLVLMMLFILACPPAYPQQRRDRMDELELSAQERDREKTALSQVPLSVPLDSPVDPTLYIVGPLDGFAVNMWTTPPLSFSLSVTPEGTLIIPTVGELRVSGMTLQGARDMVLKESRKKYSNASISVTLVRPRQLVITLVGYLENPGPYTATAVDRVGKAVGLAMVSQRDRLATRQILVRHRDGSAEHADLVMFAATGENRYNPYLREGDVIVLPERDPSRTVIGIYGGVLVPGRYEYLRGDSILDALRMAQGFSATAIPDSTELLRSNARGDLVARQVVDLAAVLDGRAPNIALEPGDRVLVHRAVEMRGDFSVMVIGEVARPGLYPITRDQTRVSQVLRSAGGFTEFASLNGAELIRRSFDPATLQQEVLESYRGGVSAEDSLYYNLETQLRIRKEVVAVDFETLFTRGDSTQDVTLRDGDEIRVPPRSRTVYVFGQVVEPGHVPFVDGKDVEYYLTKAGGVTDRAKERGIKIAKSRTRQWLDPDDTVIEAGDYVWVPKVSEYPFAYYLNVIGQTAAIVSVALSVIILASQ